MTVEKHKLNKKAETLYAVSANRRTIDLYIYTPVSLQVAQLSQRDRAARWVSNDQKWKTGTERQYLRTI